MGKSKCPPSVSSNVHLRVGMETKTSNWDICPNFSPNLMARSDKAHLQQSTMFGSPPPKTVEPQWMEDDDIDIQMNIRLEVPKLDRENQNIFQLASDEENTLRGCDHKVITDVSNSLGGMRLQPIIVCENVDDSVNDLDSTFTQDKGKRASLSVPPVDVANEKKRPPLSKNTPF